MFRNVAKADEPMVNDVSRGKLLYSLRSISCHNEQVHWLAHKKAADWPSAESAGETLAGGSEPEMGR